MEWTPPSSTISAGTPVSSWNREYARPTTGICATALHIEDDQDVLKIFAGGVDCHAAGVQQCRRAQDRLSRQSQRPASAGRLCQSAAGAQERAADRSQGRQDLVSTRRRGGKAPELAR